MKLRRFKFEKLIRNKLPEIIRSNGIVVHTPKLTTTEYIQKLNEKLLEEAQEAINTKTAQELTEELADILEVIYSISAANNISVDQIEETRKTKKASRGGFDQTTYVSFIEVPDDHRAINKYLSNPDQYPEIE